MTAATTTHERFIEQTEKKKKHTHTYKKKKRKTREKNGKKETAMIKM